MDPSEAEGLGGGHNSRVFTLCRDDSCGGYLDVVDVGAVIREVQAEQGRGRELFEILAVDSCHTQFLELAYELEGCVQVLVASQTLVPGSGWDYTAVLRAWRQAVAEARGGADTETVARVLVPAIAASYQVPGLDSPAVVSALDLRRLDDVARTFDTLCIGLMQALGEGLIWETRRLLLGLFDPSGGRVEADAFDCGSFFLLTGAALDAMADEAVQGWLGTTLQRVSARHLQRFREAVARRLEGQIEESADPERLALLVEVLRGAASVELGQRLLAVVGEGVRERLLALTASASRPPVTREQRRQARDRARDRDARLGQAVAAELRWLPAERRFDLERLNEAAETARRLARQARQAALILLGSELEAEFDDPVEAPGEARPGAVIALESTAGQVEGWPRWSGVSLYRPPKLDRLMNTNYQRFAFHRRVHWAAMLGAANLIDQHPRALWRLVSSLLATGGGHDPARGVAPAHRSGFGGVGFARPVSGPGAGADTDALVGTAVGGGQPGGRSERITGRGREAARELFAAAGVRHQRRGDHRAGQPGAAAGDGPRAAGVGRGVERGCGHPGPDAAPARHRRAVGRGHLPEPEPHARGRA
ncbi:MAG: clostripain-related cysteine peptidase [Verrucomicrobia bacterium]|nr:clostripain-related cysteine peptidase [Verrucomicrobiota bacterium]